MRKLLFALITIGFLGSCATLKTNSNKRELIEVAIDLNTVVDDKVKVEVNPKKIKENTIVYQIPAIVPGTYAMSDYGQFVTDFKAFDKKGNEMSVLKLDKNSWQINNAKKMDKITYWVDDTFDSEDKHGIYVMAGTNIEEGKNFFLNLIFIFFFTFKRST